MFIELDTRTIFISTGIICVFVGASMACIAMSRKTHPGFYEWSAGYCISGCGLFLVGMQGLMVDFLTIFVANTLIILSFVLIHRGLLRFSKEQPQLWPDIVIMIIAISTYVVFLYIIPSGVIRFSVGTAIIVCLLYKCTYISWKKTSVVIGHRNAILIVPFSLLSLFFTIRLLAGYNSPHIIGDRFCDGTGVRPYFVLASFSVLIFTSVVLIIMDARRLEMKLHHSKEWFYNMVEDIKEDYYLYSYKPEGVFTYLSPGAAKVLGMEMKQIIGRNWRDVLDTSSEMIDRGELSDAQCCLGKTPRRHEITIKRPDGQECIIEVNKRPIIEKSGRVIAIEGIVKDITYQKQAELELQKLTIIDPLTGALNRREFIRVADEELERAGRYHNDVTFMMLDIDHFKKINDSFGHDAGDEVLKKLVEVCGKTLRPSDSFFRFGGEEFIVVLSGTNKENAIHPANRLRLIFRELAIEYLGNTINFTVSIGIAQNDGLNDTVDTIMKRADLALYMAKKSGRDQVVIQNSGERVGTA